MDISSILNQFKGKRIVVLGDIMLDAYMVGSVTRISPEAPVPIVSLSQEDERLGGAANVALNLVSLGAEPVICSVIGNDQNGEKMMDLMHKAGISSEGVLLSKERKTTVKTRILGDNQQLLRIDSEQCDDILSRDEEQLLKRVEHLLQDGVDALIFEDYNKGLLTESLIKKVIQLCQSHNA